jgi:hypothetical protein
MPFDSLNSSAVGFRLLAPSPEFARQGRDSVYCAITTTAPLKAKKSGRAVWQSERLHSLRRTASTSAMAWLPVEARLENDSICGHSSLRKWIGRPLVSRTRSYCSLDRRDPRHRTDSASGGIVLACARRRRLRRGEADGGARRRQRTTPSLPSRPFGANQRRRRRGAVTRWLENQKPNQRRIEASIASF